MTDAEKRAREVLASVLDQDGLTLSAEETRSGYPPAEIFTYYAVKAIMRAQSEADRSGMVSSDDSDTMGVERLENERDRYWEALNQIEQWSAAYPLRVFPEPDFEICATALKAVGQTLDAVSASNMRHVVEGVGKIARAALRTPPTTLEGGEGA